MARYFLHLRDGTDEILDPEGSELADMNALKATILKSARELICGDIRSSGLIDLRYRIDAEDETGAIVYTLPFAHAVNIIPKRAATVGA